MLLSRPGDGTVECSFTVSPTALLATTSPTTLPPSSASSLPLAPPPAAARPRLHPPSRALSPSPTAMAVPAARWPRREARRNSEFAHVRREDLRHETAERARSRRVAVVRLDGELERAGVAVDHELRQRGGVDDRPARVARRERERTGGEPSRWASKSTDVGELRGSAFFFRAWRPLVGRRRRGARGARSDTSKKRQSRGGARSDKRPTRTTSSDEQ